MAISAIEQFRRNQNRERLQSLKPEVPLRRYVDGLDRRGELLPGAASIIVAKVLDRTRPTSGEVARADAERHQATTAVIGGDPAPNPPTVGTPRPGSRLADGGVFDLMRRLGEFLANEGSVYLTPEGRAAASDLRAVYHRFGVPVDQAERLYAATAAPLAGKTAADLLTSVVGILTDEDEGYYLGIPSGSLTAMERASAKVERPAVDDRPAPQARWIDGHLYQPVTAPGAGSRPRPTPESSTPTPTPTPSPASNDPTSKVLGAAAAGI